MRQICELYLGTFALKNNKTLIMYGKSVYLLLHATFTLEEHEM